MEAAGEVGGCGVEVVEEGVEEVEDVGGVDGDGALGGAGDGVVYVEVRGRGWWAELEEMGSGGFAEVCDAGAELLLKGAVEREQRGEGGEGGLGVSGSAGGWVKGDRTGESWPGVWLHVADKQLQVDGDSGAIG